MAKSAGLWARIKDVLGAPPIAPPRSADVSPKPPPPPSSEPAVGSDSHPQPPSSGHSVASDTPALDGSEGRTATGDGSVGTFGLGLETSPEGDDAPHKDTQYMSATPVSPESSDHPTSEASESGSTLGEATERTFGFGQESSLQVGTRALHGEAEVTASEPPEKAAVDEIRRLYREGRYEQATEVCVSHFGERTDLRDEYDQPIYYKEMLRLSLALGHDELARGFEEQLRPLLAAYDPCVEILYARHFSKLNDTAAARSAWLVVLSRAPGYGEAVTWISAHPEVTN